MVQVGPEPVVVTVFPVVVSVHTAVAVYEEIASGDPAAIASVIVYVAPWVTGQLVVDAVVAVPVVVADVNVVPPALCKPTVN
jgi:hypothetical protein